MHASLWGRDRVAGGERLDGLPVDVKPQTGTGHAPAAVDTNLAETGGSSTTPYIAGGAALLLAADCAVRGCVARNAWAPA